MTTKHYNDNNRATDKKNAKYRSKYTATGALAAHEEQKWGLVQDKDKAKESINHWQIYT